MITVYAVYTINYLILLYFIFMATVYTIFLFVAYPDIRSYFMRFRFTNIYKILHSKELPPVSIVIPVYNEGVNACEAIKSALKNDYKRFEIIAVNDASTDDTLQILINEFDLVRGPSVIEEKIPTKEVRQVYFSKTDPRLCVIDKEHGGAGDAINAGINASVFPFFMTFDADSLMEPNTISELMFSILTEPHTIAVGGAVCILNNCVYRNGEMIEPRIPNHLVPALQTTEYLRSHVFNRTAWNKFGGTISYSGTATLFEKDVVIASGGFDLNNWAQDAEIVMRLHKYMRNNKYPYHIYFNPASTTWTDVPHDLKEYTAQRNHWQRGLLRSVFKNITLFFNPRYGAAGLFAYPLYLISEVFSPFIELLAYLMIFVGFALGIVTWQVTLLFVILAWGFISYLTMANVLLNYVTFNHYHKKGDQLWMLVLTFIEMFGFHQYQVVIRVWASLQFFVNKLLGRPI